MSQERKCFIQAAWKHIITTWKHVITKLEYSKSSLFSYKTKNNSTSVMQYYHNEKSYEQCQAA